jgi:hypothetical protein
LIDLLSRCKWFLAAPVNLNLASSINLAFTPDFRGLALVFHLTGKLFGSFKFRFWKLSSSLPVWVTIVPA